MKDTKKISLAPKDISYIYQYIKFNFNKIKKYRNITLFLSNDTEHQNFFKFIESLDPGYLKKSKLVYISKNENVNKNLFDTESINILTIQISEYLLAYLSIKVGYNKVKEKVESKLKGLFLKNLIFIIIYFLTAYGIIYIIGDQVGAMGGESGTKISTKSIQVMAAYNGLIQLFFLILTLSILGFKTLRHYGFYNYGFSKILVLLDYKMFVLFLLLSKLNIKNKNKTEISYINIKNDFFKFSQNIGKYLTMDELIGYQIFVGGYGKAFSCSNFLLAQAVVLDYYLIDEYQKKNTKLKMVMLNDLKNSMPDLIKELDNTFSDDYEKLKDSLSLMTLYIYLYVVIITLITIVPMIVSAL